MDSLLKTNTQLQESLEKLQVELGKKDGELKRVRENKWVQESCAVSLSNVKIIIRNNFNKAWSNIEILLMYSKTAFWICNLNLLEFVNIHYFNNEEISHAQDKLTVNSVYFSDWKRTVNLRI